MADLFHGKNQAIVDARLLRGKCEQLVRDCQKLEVEKDTVRYFWRTKVLEGQSRGGQMLMQSLTKRYGYHA